MVNICLSPSHEKRRLTARKGTRGEAEHIQRFSLLPEALILTSTGKSSMKKRMAGDRLGPLRTELAPGRLYGRSSRRL